MNIRNNRRPSILMMAYAALFLMALLAVWNPSLTLGPGPVDLLLLLDESNSIDTSHNDAVWQSFLQQSRSLPAGSRISLMRFSDRASVEVPWLSIGDAGFDKLLHDSHPPRHRILDPGATSIAPALTAAMSQTDPARRTAIIISSDGIDSVTPRQNAFMLNNNNAWLSLFYLDSTREQQNAPLHIESINIPPASILGSLLTLSVALESASGGQGTLETLLNDRVVNKQALVLEPGERRVVNLHLRSGEADTQMLEFVVRDANDHVIERHKRMVKNRDGQQLLYIGNRNFSSQARSLQTDNWQVVELQPQRLPADSAFFNRFDTVVLDDVGSSNIDAVVTHNLIRAIKRYGTGLIVLGGPHSFGSGGYRHSELEAVMPVISEASRPLPGAAFVFLLDKSGSMEAANRSNSRLADALRAVSESAKSLRPGDESALLAFDRDVEILLPLERRADPENALDKNWRLQPSGGTQLAPAVEQAVELLARSNSTRRFLILVTDGFVDADNIEPLKRDLAKAEIQLIALAIGRDADISTLRSLAANNGGRVLRIDDAAELPRFMRHELETELQSWKNASVTPRDLHHAPFINEQTTAWRTLNGYQVTRARPAADVYVASDDGDPLLAVFQSGAGRVAALPGGMLEPLNGSDLLGGLLGWMNNRQPNPNLKVSHSYLSGELALVVDAVDATNEWQPATTAQVTLTSPGGISHTQALQAVAPGRFSAVIEAPEVGVYNARLEVGNQQMLYSAYLANDSENEHHAMVPWLQHALATGEIQRWNEAGLSDLLASSSGQVSTRALWLLLALNCYLALIAYERSSGLRTLKNAVISLVLRRKSPDQARADTMRERTGSKPDSDKIS